MATTSSQTSAQQAAAQALATFLELAREYPVFQPQGSFALASAGGASPVSFPNPIPTESVWARRIELFTTLNLTITVPASGTVTVSPLAPFSAIRSTFGINNQAYWTDVPATAHWLDDMTLTRTLDASFNGQSDGGGNYPNATGQAYLYSYTANYAPGTTVTNSGTASEVLTVKYVFAVPIRLQRYIRRPFGLVPLGDPDNRPNILVNLNGLVGTDPAKSLLVNASAGVTATTSATVASTCAAIYPALEISLLPQGATASPVPTVGLGLQVNEVDSQGLTAGVKYPLKHRTAFIYERIIGILESGQVPVEPDYVGLEPTDSERSALWTYTVDNNNMADKYRLDRDRYHRLLPLGCQIVDLSSNDFPDLPNASPSVNEMTPSINLAAALPGLIPTPAMQTRWRLPAGNAGTNPLLEAYEFGLAPVGY